MQATLLVLAGGHGRRAGRPKAWIEVGDTYLLRHVTDRLASEFDDVIVSFAEPEQLEQPVPYRVVFDRKHDGGPLAGIESGLLAARNDVVFAIACDMPYVTRQLARMAVTAARTCDAAIPRVDGRREPLAAAYRTTALPAIIEALDEGRLRAGAIADHLDVTWLEHADAEQFASLNTADEIARFNANFPTRR